jgi:hypothetical protein
MMQSRLAAMETCRFDAISGLMPWRLAGLVQLRLEAIETCRFDAIWARGHGDLQV